MSRALRAERGFAVVTAVMVMGIMLSFGLATLAYVDGQQAQSAGERVRESGFNLAEVALESEVVFLASRWPGSAGIAYPAACTRASTGATCPDAGSVSGGLGGSDFAAGQYSWATEVHDNGAPGPRLYTEEATRLQPSFDANGDGSVWARSEGLVRGRKRIVVALVKREQVVETFPRNVVSAGFVQITNNGRKTLIDTQGGTGAPTKVVVRCGTATEAPSTTSTCIKWDPAKRQVYPLAYQTAAAGVACYEGGPTKCALSDAALARLEASAQNAGTYFCGATSCPSGVTGRAGCPPASADRLVYVEAGPCELSGTHNSQASPGVVVVERGTVTLSGNGLFYGLVYAANATGLTSAVFSITGGAHLQGGVAVDRDGGLSAGSSGLNIVYDSRAFDPVASSGSTAIVQNTFRELPSR